MLDWVSIEIIALGLIISFLGWLGWRSDEEKDNHLPGFISAIMQIISGLIGR